MSTLQNQLLENKPMILWFSATYFGFDDCKLFAICIIFQLYFSILWQKQVYPFIKQCFIKTI